MSNNNNKAILRLRDEENNPGHEIILRSLPNENEMAAANNHNHPEEEPDADEDEQPFSYGRWRPAWAWRRSRALTAFLAAAGVGAAVGGGSAVFRAAGAGGKASTTITSNMQVANVVSAPTGFEVVGNVGDGFCVDGNSQGYPTVLYIGIATADACATKCNACVAGDFTFVGMQHNPTTQGCVCYVSQTVPNVDLSQINSIGGCEYLTQSSSESGTGPIAGTNSNPGWTCYRFVGGGSNTDVPSIAPSESSSDVPSVSPSTPAPSDIPSVSPSTTAPSDIPSVAPSTPAPSDIPSAPPSTSAPSDIPSEAPSSSSSPTAKASKRPRGRKPKSSKIPKASSSLQVQQMTSGGDPSFSSLSVAGVCGTFAVIIITFMFIDLI